MVAGGLPAVQVLLDDGTGTFPYDISTYARLVEGYTFKRGRQDEMSAPTAGDMTLVLDNIDGRFTVGSTIIATPSPIKNDRQIRVKVTPSGGTAVTRFTHYVQNWPVEWPDGSDQFAVASITGTDAQAKAERWPFESVIQTAVRADSPNAYYPGSEAAGATGIGDASTNAQAALNVAGTGTAPVFGSSTLGDGFSAPRFSKGQYLEGTVDLGSIPTSVTLEAVVSSTDTSAGPFLETSISSWVLGYIDVTTQGSLGISDGSSILQAIDSNREDGNPHHIAVIFTATTVALYVDGSLVTSTATTNVLSQFVTLRVGGAPHYAGFGGAPWIGRSPESYIGTIGRVAIWGSALTGAQIAAHAAAVAGYTGDTSDARITRIANAASIPLGTLDAGLTTITPFETAPSSVAEAWRQVADAEMGLAYINGSGALDFHNRNRVAAKTSPDVTIDANFLAEGTRFEYDMQGVLNYLEVVAAGTGVTQVARNVTSEVTNKHGRYPDSRNYLVRTDAEALDRGNWIVSTHAEPAARVGQLAFDVMTMTAAQQQSMLTLEADSWLRVTGLPGQTPGGTTADFIVQGLAEALNAGEWTLTLNAANKPALFPTPWILDDTTYSVLDSTTRIFV
jgi:hypothetical protein